MEQSADGMALANLEGNLLFVNESWVSMHGYKSYEELLGKNLSIFHNKEQLKKDVDQFNRKVMEKGYNSGEVGHICQAGTIFPTLMTTTLLRDENGNPIAIAGVATNITERKKAEDKLKESENLYRTLVETSTDGIVLTDLKGKYLFCNTMQAEILGYENSAEIIGKNGFAFIAPESQEESKKTLQKLQKEKSVQGEFKIIRKDGSIFPAEYSSTMINDEKGNPVSILVMIRDITQRKQAEEALKAKTKEAQLLADMLDKSSQPFAAGSPDGKLTRVNSAFCSLTGYSKEELLNDVSWNETLTPKEWREYEGELLQKVLISGEPQLFEKEYFHKSGKRIPVELLMHRKVDDNNNIQYVYGFITDITERKQAEKELRENEERFRTLIEQSTAAIEIYEPDGKLLIVNDAWSKFWDLKKETIANFNILTDPECERTGLTAAFKMAQQGRAEMLPDILYDAEESDFSGGRKLWISSRMYPIKDTAKKVQNIILTYNDITERKLAEEELGKQKDYLEKAQHIGQIGTWEYNTVTDSTYWTDEMYKIFGIPHGTKISSKQFFDCVHPDDRDKVQKTFREAFETKIHDLEFRIIYNKKVKWVREKANYIIDKTGIVTRVIGVTQDISERKQVEKSLIESEEKYRLITTNTLDTIWTTDIEFNLTFVNDAISKFLGYTPEEFIGLNPSVFTTKEGMKTMQNVAEQLVAKYKEKEFNQSIFELKQIKKDGTLIDVEIRANLLLDRDKNIIGFQGRSVDITEPKQIEELLKQSEQKHKLLIKNSSDLLMSQNIDGKLTYISPQCEEILGFTIDEVRSLNIQKQIHPDDLGMTQKTMYITLKGKELKNLEYRFIKKNGDIVWLNHTARPIIIDNKILEIQSTVSDITERKRASQIQKVLYNISNAVSITKNLDELISRIQAELGTIIDTTNFYIALYDNKTDTLSLPFFIDEKDAITSFPAGKTLTYYVIRTEKSLLATKEELTILEKNGDIESFGSNSEIWLGVPLKIEGKVTGVLAVQSYTDENAYDESDKEILEFVSHQISISIERKKAEEDLKSALEKAHESDRLKSAFLSNMSHEIRTPMNGILGFTELLKEPQLTGDEKERYIRIIEKSGDRMLNTINDIIDISKIEAGQVEVVKSEVSLNIILKEQYTFFNSEAQSKGLELIYKPTLSDKEAIIVADKHKLEGILTNLIKNAIKFTKKGNISFGYSLKKEKGFEGLEFYVKDTGIGIPSDRIRAIFNRFEQADIKDTRVFEGSGLGLAISKSYVEMLGGKIWVVSEEAIGSTFYFTIPYKTQKPKETITTPTAKINQEKYLENISILVAEDDLTSVLLFKEIFKGKFHNIFYTKSGTETIEEIKKNPGIDIILMDIKMPEMDGYTATREIRKFNREVIIIAQTAFGLSGDRKKAIDAGCNDYITKPIIKDRLLEMIWTHIGSSEYHKE